MKNRICPLLLAAVLGLAGCSAVHRAEEAVANVEQGTAQTGPFAMSEQRAHAVILAAIKEGWPDELPMPLGAGRIGYEFQLRFLIDRERITVEALPSGSEYVFRVVNRGTAPAVGVPARNKLVPLLEKHAKQ